MKPILTMLVVLTLSASALAQQPSAADVPQNMAPFQGTWALVPDGAPAAKAPEILLTIAGDRYAQLVGGKVAEHGTMRVDVTTKPMTIDLSITSGADAGKTQVGLVEVSGGTMTMHLSMPGSTTRPKSMAPQEGFLLFAMKKK